MQVESLLEQLFFTTVFIETATIALGDGEPQEIRSSGTGFLYHAPITESMHVAFVVTNKHVVANGSRVTIRFMAADPSEPDKPLLGHVRNHVVTDPATEFIGHPDPLVDVAVLTVGPFLNTMNQIGTPVFSRALTDTHAADNEKMDSLDALEQVTFFGYPNGLYDSVNFLPIARRGYTASPLSVDYEGKPMFLIDASVFPGSSGSPVLIAEAGSFVSRRTGLMVGNRILLLGVLAAVYQRTIPVLEVPALLSSVVQDTINIGIVYKQSAITETIDIALERHGLSRYEPSSATPAVVPSEGSETTEAIPSVD
jgi:hypothetical protein